VTRASFLSAAVNGKIAPELKSSNKPARDNERLKSDFMVVSESKQKRESATDISDVIEAADSTKAIRIRRSYSAATAEPRKDSWLDRVSPYHLGLPN
jgi:predicted DNA-binding transcriptional regulator YafY